MTYVPKESNLNIFSYAFKNKMNNNYELPLEHLHFLHVYECPFRKIRLGSHGDGGFVIAELPFTTYDCFISAGVGDNETFAADLIRKYPSLSEWNSFAFDGTIDIYPHHHTTNISFIKKNISTINSDHHTNLESLIKKHDSIFLKMDIEGSEYDWLIHLPQTYLDKFPQIVIEVHGVNDDSWDNLYVKKSTSLEKLCTNHVLVHAHGNNNSGTHLKYPHVLELTYVHKRYWKYLPLVLNTLPLPSPNLDYKCNHEFDELDLNFPPFVHSVP